MTPVAVTMNLGFGWLLTTEALRNGTRTTVARPTWDEFHGTLTLAVLRGRRARDLTPAQRLLIRSGDGGPVSP